MYIYGVCVSKSTFHDLYIYFYVSSPVLFRLFLLGMQVFFSFTHEALLQQEKSLNLLFNYEYFAVFRRPSKGV